MQQINTRLLTWLCVLAFCAPGLLSAQVLTTLKQKKMEHKDDVVVMDNGDRITGEIRKVEFGILYLKSDRAVDSLKLDWKRVTRVESRARYEFEVSTREYYIGTIAPDANHEIPLGELLVLLDGGSSVRLKIRDIIGIREMQHSILGRISLSLDAGISFTSGNDRTQTTLSASIAFQRLKHSLQLELDSQFSGEPGAESTSRHELQMGVNRVLSQKWETIFLASILKDNQQELDLRATVGGGVQRILLKSNRTMFSALGGVVYTNENYFPEADADRNNAEILTGMTFATYHFRGSQFDATLLVFPSLSDPGRVRVDTYVDWKWDIVADLYWKMSLINNYDSRPPGGVIHNNLSVNSSVGWSF